MKLDTIITGDSAVVLQGFEPDCIDLTVTSPPYDNLRTYNGFTFDFETIARELFRVTKAGGVVVWVVGDATINGSESGTSFKQALFFKECGFNLHQTMFYEKDGLPFPPSNRYYSQVEYMFVLSKGAPKTANLLQVKNAHAGTNSFSSFRQQDGSQIQKDIKISKSRPRTNIWKYGTGNGKTTLDKFAFEHPAMFPEKLASDHIETWSNPNDVVLDCFCGAGTTVKMSKMLSRHYLGIEISPEYVALAEKRLLTTNVPLFVQERGLTQRAADGYAASQQSDFFAVGDEPAKVSGAKRRR